MVIINQCRIDDEGKCLIIDAEVSNLSYYKDVYLDSVIIDTQETYSPNGPMNDPIFECEKNQKSLHLRLPAKELKGINLNKDILFIYIRATGVPDIACPCGMDNEYTMGIAVNLRPIYNMAMSYMRELSNNCSIPKGFIDMILKLKAFELSLKTGNFEEAISKWNTLFKNKINVSPNKGCGCNGIN